jgi:hypothetical protein
MHEGGLTCHMRLSQPGRNRSARRTIFQALESLLLNYRPPAPLRGFIANSAPAPQLVLLSIRQLQLSQQVCCWRESYIEGILSLVLLRSQHTTVADAIIPTFDTSVKTKQWPQSGSPTKTDFVLSSWSKVKR